MSIGYFLGGGLSPVPGIGAELHDRYPIARRSYTEVTEWTGYSTRQLLQLDPVPATARPGGSWALPEIQQAALQIAIHDVLAEAGVYPAAVGGVSLGAMVSGCLAGSISRPDLFGLLMRSDEIQDIPDGPEQGFALAMIPNEIDATSSYGEHRPGVHLAADFGPSSDGSKHVFMFSGHRAALDELVADMPPFTVFVAENMPVAVHSPLRQHVRDHMEPYLAATEFRDPVLPVCSCLEAKTLTTADEVRDLFRRNATSTVSVVHVCSRMRAHDVEFGIVLGTSIPEGLLRFPFPVAYVERPDQIVAALSAIYDLGIELSPAAEVAR